MSIEEPHHLTILTNYLVRPCPGSCEQVTRCIFYHSTSERRRIPFTANGLAYSDVICPKVSSGQTCSDSCQFSHNFQEIVYHPNRYKTVWCEQFNCKGFYWCHQAHKPNEKLRNFTHFMAESNTQGITFSTHLDLNSFKTEPCNITEAHNPKLCVFYHSNRDRRRNGTYNYELCAEHEKDMCANIATCTKCHNRVEQLYHPDKYKMKFCTFYPKKIHECEYSSYCSFAHSETDIKTELIHNYQKNETFYMNSFKTAWCPFILQHDKALCVYAHNWQDFRRKPKDFNYQPIPCSNWKSSNFILSYEEGGCKDMISCNKCHGWKEIEFHPSVYKMKPCSLGRKCTKPQDCPFYHGASDKRNNEGSPLREVSNHMVGQTPHPQRQFLSPDSCSFKAFQTPFIQKQSTGGYAPSKGMAEEVRKINATTDEFVLHRGVAARNTDEGFLSRKKPENSPFCRLLVEDFPVLNTPVKENFVVAATPQSKDLDSRVLQFLNRHKLKRLAKEFKGVKWEDLEGFHLDNDYDDDEFREAWNEEKEDQDQLDELINNDIALFTGLKTGNTPDLHKFKHQDDIDDFIVTFPKSSFIPLNLKCPITKKLMRDPAVFSLDGRTYERAAITEHILKSYNRLEAQQLVRNLASDKYVRQELLTRYS